MEAEARKLIVDSFAAAGSSQADSKGSWVDELRARLAEIGHVDLELPPREKIGRPIDFSGPDYE
jgi:hypothetical protein